MIVVVHHLFSLNVDQLKAVISPFLFSSLAWLSEKNVAAVLFFFVVSGFSIGLSLHNKSLIDKTSVNEYLYRRAKRILPIYWLALALSLLISILVPTIRNPSFSSYNLIGNLLFLQTPEVVKAWFVPYGNNGPLWSLSYEFFFYLLAIPTIIISVKRKLSPAVLIISFVLISILMIGFNHVFANPLSAFLILYPIWLTGYILSQLYLKKSFNKAYFMIVMIIFLFLEILNSHYIKSSSINVLILGIAISLLCSAIYMLYQLKPFKKLFNPLVYMINQIFYKVGLASFSIYIFHYAILSLEKHFDLPIYIQIITISILVPLCYYFETWIIKKPFIFLKKQYV